MARSVSLKQSQGNQVRGAMVEFLMDGNLTVPDAWDVGVSVAVDDAEGTEVNAAEAVLAATSGATDNKEAISALVAAINANIVGVHAYYVQNSVNEYVINVEGAGSGWEVTLSSPLFEASS